MNADKSEYRYFNHEGCMSSINGGFQKLAVKLTYLVTALNPLKVISACAERRTVIDRLSIIRKKYQSGNLKKEFLQSRCCVGTTVRMHYMDAENTYREKGRTGNPQECYEAYWNNPRGNMPRNHSWITPYLQTLSFTFQILVTRWSFV